ncbi:unnamed protein product [Leptidea sinapis]|uniref:Uncharacterized protein n=1 Tax=Leptidea sinapis TaxID=189913 RepID=A0A5E4PQA2_9NEOP|nr:unnamed protein product [Leptidea sinapis]
MEAPVITFPYAPYPPPISSHDGHDEWHGRYGLRELRREHGVSTARIPAALSAARAPARAQVNTCTHTQTRCTY